LSFKNFQNTWNVFLVLETDLAAPGGTLTISGTETDVQFFPVDMGSEGDNWKQATGVYNEDTDQITGQVSGSMPNNNFAMAVGSPGTTQQFLNCVISRPLQEVGGMVEGGDPGSWTATDGPGEF
jgi:hypothetical protein